MKAQRHYRLPAGYELTNEIKKREANRSWGFGKNPRNKYPSPPQFGTRKSKKPVTLAKKA